MVSGGRLMVIKGASQRLSPHLLVDTHQGPQARCERTPGAHRRGLPQSAETYAPQQAWQVLGQPAIAINANFFDVRPQFGAPETHRLQFAARRLRRQHRRRRRANMAVTGPWPTRASRPCPAGTRCGRR